MPISVNEGGTLYKLDSVTSNEGGALYSLNKVHSNEGGVLYEIFSGVVNELSWYVVDSSSKTVITDYDGDGKYLYIQGDSRYGTNIDITECRTQPFIVGSNGVRIGAWIYARRSYSTSGSTYISMAIVQISDDGEETTIATWVDRYVSSETSFYVEGTANVVNLSAGKYFLKITSTQSDYAYLRISFGDAATGQQLAINFDNGTSVSNGDSSSASFSVRTPTAVNITFKSSASAKSVSSVYIGGGTGTCTMTLPIEEDEVKCIAESSGAAVNTSLTFSLLLLPNVNYTISLSTTVEQAGGNATAQFYQFTETILT